MIGRGLTKDPAVGGSSFLAKLIFSRMERSNLSNPILKGPW